MLLVVALGLVLRERLRRPLAARRLARARLRRVRRPVRRAAAVAGSAAAATHKGVLYAARHDLLPVGAYFLGRGLAADRPRAGARLSHGARHGGGRRGVRADRRLRDPALVVAARASGWFSDQLGLDYRGLVAACRRTSSTTPGTASSSGGSSRRSSRRSRRRTCSWSRCSSCRSADAGASPLALLLFAALLWTHTRSALLALVVRAARARARCAARCGRSRGRSSSR